jgi:hypothetical protein
MASTSETGHSKNVSNFESLTILCSTLGNVYNPPKPQLSIGAMNSQLVSAQNALSDVFTQKAIIFQAIQARREQTTILEDRVMQVINLFEIVDVPIEVVKAAKALKNKILGRRSGNAASTETPQSNADTTGPETNTNLSPRTISTSQLSFDKKVEHFERMIQLLATEPNYTPNEPDLNVNGLNSLLSTLRQVDTSLKNAQVTYKGYLDQRDQILYKDEVGLVFIGSDVKKYLKGVFGVNSAAYKQAKPLQFTKK